MKVIYNITKNKFNASLNQETTEIKVSFKTGYYPLPVGLENYYTKTESDARYKPINYVPTWSEISGKPTFFSGNYNDLSNIPTTFPPSTHTHTIGQITNLQTTLDGKLEKGTYTGTAENLKSDIDDKQNILSSFDESILLESDGNIEGNVSLFSEIFETQNCVLEFNPIQIVGVYKNGLKLYPSDYNIILPKTIQINSYTSGKIEVQYTHLKNLTI